MGSLQSRQNQKKEASASFFAFCVLLALPGGPHQILSKGWLPSGGLKVGRFGCGLHLGQSAQYVTHDDH